MRWEKLWIQHMEAQEQQKLHQQQCDIPSQIQQQSLLTPALVTSTVAPVSSALSATLPPPPILSLGRSKSGTNPPTPVLCAQTITASSALIDPAATTTPSRPRASAISAQILSKVTDALSTFAHILSPAPSQFKAPPIDTTATTAVSSAILPSQTSLTLTPQLTRKRSNSASAVRCIFGLVDLQFVSRCLAHLR
jgi:hypothetical protein